MDYYNQTPEQQQALGDDSVTRLLPENYMVTQGDDSVTQLLPENYMTAQGDDTATVMLDPMGQHMPQQNVNQQSGFGQSSFGAVNGIGTPHNFNNGSYVQAAFRPENNYFGANAPVGSSAAIAAKKASVLGIIFGILNLCVLGALIVSGVLFLKRPLYYIFESYVGGAVSEAVIIEEMEAANAGEIESVFTVIAGASLVFFVLAAVFALLSLLRIAAGSVKSPAKVSVIAFKFTLLPAILNCMIKVFFEITVNDIFKEYSEISTRFNIYNINFILMIAAVVMGIANIVVAATERNR